MRIKVKIDVLKPLKRVARVVDKDGGEKIGVIKYERLPDFYYVCGLIGHTIKNFKNKKEGIWMNDSNLQFGSWMRAPIVTPNQERGLRRNRVDVVISNARAYLEKDESNTNLREESKQHGDKGKERVCEEESMSTSPLERRIHKTGRDGLGRFKNKRKRNRGSHGDNTDESPIRVVKRKLLENVSPFKAVASDQPQPHQEP
ncbi:hypothetical protein PVK06_027186 [Gossypium arboreum]|uniref:Zinc knuckle CX2CX4HX4C domain-containing protein n=1 Tax=Gossypium arboreum TaxID=29729 RepID=A0ABR0NZM5_GOSAR|nr:hypothetical protein PVK06_027186 [Gossypium arboreum]